MVWCCGKVVCGVVPCVGDVLFVGVLLCYAFGSMTFLTGLRRLVLCCSLSLDCVKFCSVYLFVCVDVFLVLCCYCVHVVLHIFSLVLSYRRVCL